MAKKTTQKTIVKLTQWLLLNRDDVKGKTGVDVAAMARAEKLFEGAMIRDLERIAESDGGSDDE